MTPADFDALKAAVQFAAYRVRGMPLAQQREWKDVVRRARAALRRLRAQMGATVRTGSDDA